MSVSHERLLLHKNAAANINLSFDNVCKKKQVYVAYKNHPGFFEVSSYTGQYKNKILYEWSFDVSKGEMVKYPLWPYVKYKSMSWEWETQAAFFKFYNIKPIWLNTNTAGTLNYTTGQWSGAVGMIQRDEADYAVAGFTGTHPMSKVAAFSPSEHLPFYWLTRYPLELPPTWNLLGLFTKGCISQMSLIFIYHTEILFGRILIAAF